MTSTLPGGKKILPSGNILFKADRGLNGDGDALKALTCGCNVELIIHQGEGQEASPLSVASSYVVANTLQDFHRDP